MTKSLAKQLLVPSLFCTSIYKGMLHFELEVCLMLSSLFFFLYAFFLV